MLCSSTLNMEKQKKKKKKKVTQKIPVFKMSVHGSLIHINLKFGMLCLEGQYKVHAKKHSSKRFYGLYTLVAFRRFRYRFMSFFWAGWNATAFLDTTNDKKCKLINMILKNCDDYKKYF